MNEINFCFWLKGMIEITDPETIDARRTEIIKDHLELVMDKAEELEEIVRRKHIIGRHRGSGSGIVMC